MRKHVSFLFVDKVIQTLSTRGIHFTRCLNVCLRRTFRHSFREKCFLRRTCRRRKLTQIYFFAAAKNSVRLYLLFYKKKGSTLRCCLGFLIERSVVALVFVLAGGLRLFAALYAGALIVLFLSQIGKNAGLCAAALKSFQSVIQRLVFLDVDFRHVFPSLQIRLAALQGPMNWLLTLILYRFTRQMSIITLQV